MHSIDTWTHLDHSMKIKRWTLSDASSSHMMWQNQSASQSIERTWLNDDNSWTNIQYKLLIEDEETHRTIAPNFLYKLTCSSMEKFVLRCFEQIKLFRQLSLGITWFLLLLDSFLCPGSIWNQEFLERIKRKHLLNAKLHLWNRGMKSLWSSD